MFFPSSQFFTPLSCPKDHQTQASLEELQVEVGRENWEDEAYMSQRFWPLESQEHRMGAKLSQPQNPG